MLRHPHCGRWLLRLLQDAKVGGAHLPGAFGGVRQLNSLKVVLCCSGRQRLRQIAGELPPIGAVVPLNPPRPGDVERNKAPSDTKPCRDAVRDTLEARRWAASRRQAASHSEACITMTGALRLRRRSMSPRDRTTPAGVERRAEPSLSSSGALDARSSCHHSSFAVVLFLAIHVPTVRRPRRVLRGPRWPCETGDLLHADRLLRGRDRTDD